ncbi:MAG: hypothetical protein ACI9GH_000455 [Candidatus Paceibacteria bacterium]|jgi:uncharacterized protein YggU (UPF0235/DUF167 family)
MYIHLKVKTGQKEEYFREIKDNHFEVSLKENAERNMANKRILELVRDNFKNNKGVKIMNGHHSPSKLVSVNLED